MSAQAASSNHVEMTESFVRLYVFLAQTLDRCLDQAQRESFPEKEHQAFLAEARAKAMAAVAGNPVVKRKVGAECGRILKLAASYPKARANKTALRRQIKDERDMLKTKLVALSDLLAVFRAQ